MFGSQTRKRLLAGFLSFGLLSGCASFSDGPFRPVSGRLIPADRRQQIAAQNMVMADVRREIGEPEEIAGSSGDEIWTFVNIRRRSSVDKSFLGKKNISCQFMRTASVVTFGSGRVTKTDTASTIWSTTQEKDKNCSE